MAGSSSSSSTSSGGSYIPDYPQSPLLMEIAQYARGQAANMLAWGQQQYSRNNQLTDQILHEAAIFASPTRQAMEMGRAEAGVGQAAEAGRQNALRDLEKFGIDPSSGRYAALEHAERSKEAAAKAGAGQMAQRATEATGRQMRTEGLNAQLANTQIGANLMRMPNDYLQTASNLKYPPLGHNQQSQSRSSSSQSDPAQQPRESGSGRERADPHGRPTGGGSGSGDGGNGGRERRVSDGSGGSDRGFSGYGDMRGGLFGNPSRIYDNVDSHNDANWMYDPDPAEMAKDYKSYYGDDGTDFSELYSGGGNDSGTDPYGYGGGYGDEGSGYDVGGADFGSGGGEDNWGGASYAPSNDSDSDWGSGDFDSGGYDDFAQGGAVGVRPTTGGAVPRQASPSAGVRTDDVPANLNVGEFVIPKDVAAWKGQEFFQKLIMTSRKNRVTAPAKGKPSDKPQQQPTFSSQQQPGMG